MSILKEIKTKNRKKIWRTISALVLIGLMIWGYFFYTKSNDIQEQFKTYTVSRKTITSSLTSDWKVLYKEQYDLNFPISWTLSNIYKKEWEDIKKWDLIAKLDDTYLKINLDKARIAVTNAQASLNAKLASKWQASDINVSEAQLESSKTALETNIAQWQLEVKAAEDNLTSTKKDLENAISNLEIIRSQENLNIKNSQERALIEADAIMPLLDKFLNETDVILGVSDANRSLNNAYEIFLWAKNPQTYLDAVKSYNQAAISFKAFNDSWRIFKANPDYEKIWDYIQNISLVGNQTNQALNDTVEVLKFSLPSSAFLQTSIDSNIVNLKNNISSLDAQVQKITLARQAIDIAKNSLSTKADSQQNNIDSLEIKVRLSQNALDAAKTKLDNSIAIAKSQIWISEANLNLKKDSFDPRELEPFRVAIQNANKWVEEAQKKLDDAYLRSPIDWKIWKLSTTKIWTLININPTIPFATIINKNSLYVEAKIEEWDISKLHLWQKTKLTFNSIENVVLDWAVSYISDKAETDQNWIVTYKVEIPFDAKDSWAKEGFTTQIAFEQITKENVLSVPFEAVKEENWTTYATLLDKQKREVKVWINDWDNLEIISWLQEWDVIRY
ncbi:MAG: Efflux transporter, RND family, MFP subunit [uncultured bacterium (gcode 4)]|uniref:Efflux transporter, RND family, MFP subunit n=1 Tax=uncultured bacterium (gcode 4) TaxID=1234023 RepID=K2G372_9BACT|nr:MAG: Efflux transporter, RND family, MFP subunit [uncultured bacterium (gcode 4)]